MYMVRFTLGLVLVLALSAPGQVTLEIVLDQEQFLRDESLPIKVRITNRSGQTLQLGEDNDWLTFAIASRDGFPVQQLGAVPVAGEFELESSQVATRRLDLMPYFLLSEAGRYTVTARLQVKQWDREISSPPKTFDIIRGTKIWEQEFGVPAPAGVPEVRKYVLLQANNLKRLMLYLRLTDPTDLKVFHVTALGQLVSFSRPEAQVDKASNLHVLFQTGARAFLYYMFSPAGTVLRRETHAYGRNRPMLRHNDEGKIFVAGGLRWVTAEDIPPPEPAPAADTNPPALLPPDNR